MSDYYLKVVPCPGSAKTQGTLVVGPDGKEIGGITRIELVAEMNDLWRARIDCMVSIEGEIVLIDGHYKLYDSPHSISDTARIYRAGKPINKWQKVMLWLAGFSAG